MPKHLANLVEVHLLMATGIWRVCADLWRRNAIWSNCATLAASKNANVQ